MTHETMTKKQARTRAIELLNLVGIPDPAKRLRTYPHEFSGGDAAARDDCYGIILQPISADRR
ncbi:hypothetical protein RWE15_05420 [Virgibacillus halophilus]|uniref:Uncharacterized protein n=1 Tax=Tigheibacillus halophilus TaxID=361280 RepID=A0ABU5C4M0_9BACI|nr:hypothetical protein [Virgibacillus halophilus]